MAAPTNLVRLALLEPDFYRLLEIIENVEDPVVYKLKAKRLQYEGKQLAKAQTQKSSKRASKKS